jgi:hypothetical protein
VICKGSNKCNGRWHAEHSHIAVHRLSDQLDKELQTKGAIEHNDHFFR